MYEMFPLIVKAVCFCVCVCIAYNLINRNSYNWGWFLFMAFFVLMSFSINQEKL